jgi:glycosyltransferase involved in cell wall biosynthesis
MSPSPRPWASVVIPIKDELDNLRPLTERLVKVLDGLEHTATAPYEIVYVDDGSTDGSSALLDELVKTYPSVKVIHFDRNYGQTSGFDAGFRHATGDLIITMDGDLQLDPGDIPLLLPLAASHDLVCGWRKDRHDNLIRKISSRIAFFVRSRVTGDPIHDTGCSLKVFRRAVIERVPLFEGMHRFFPALANIYGFTLAEVPVHHYPRAHGQSKYGLGIGSRLFKSLYDLFAVRWMQHRCLRYKLREK